MRGKQHRSIASDDLTPVAGGGLLDRRLFLKYGLAAGVVAGLVPRARAGEASPSDLQARPPWMHEPGRPFSEYGLPSEHEQNVIRLPVSNRDAPGNGVSWTPLHRLEGAIVPNGLHFERHHNGVPEIDPARHRLLIHGLVRRPLTFTVENLLRYPLISRLCFLECGGNSNAAFNKRPVQSPAGYFHGLVSCSEWTGIPLATLLDEAGPGADARWIIAEGADAFAMNLSIPIEKALADGMLALYQNGERLRTENGYPMRLLLPGWEGVLNVKWVRRLELASRPVMARNETARYTELLPDGKARMFTFVMEAKSLITAPSSGMTLPAPGLYQISGLAWSGRGRVSRVEVSADGGSTWAEAMLQEPVLPQCFTRFRIPWRWDGQPAILQSRVTDETGYRQPTRAELIEKRGRQGFFHYNAIISWKVGAEGGVTHVYDTETGGAPDAGDLPPVDAEWF
jgi:sulfane dehydrogenase subunit SoxC